MMIDILNVLNKELNKLKLNYEFGEYTKKIQYPYIVGDYIENPINKECAEKSGTIILSIFTRDRKENNIEVKGNRLELEEIGEKIENYFKHFVSCINGNTVSIEYEYRTPVDTEDEVLKRIDIYLNVSKWEGK